MDDNDLLRFMQSLVGSRMAATHGVSAFVVAMSVATRYHNRIGYDVDLFSECGLAPAKFYAARKSAVESGWIRFESSGKHWGRYQAVEAVRAEIELNLPDPPRVQKTELRQFADLLRTHEERALSRGLASTLTLAQWGHLLESTEWCCAMCGSAENIEVEHMIPISRGGGHTLDNVAPMCQKCNASKHASTPLEWIWRSDVR
jgi:hypothetical protein